MIEKLQRNLRMIAFAWRIGAALWDKLVLTRLLTRHILVNRGWAAFTGEVTDDSGRVQRAGVYRSSAGQRHGHHHL